MQVRIVAAPECECGGAVHGSLVAGGGAAGKAKYNCLRISSSSTEMRLGAGGRRGGAALA